MTDNPFSIPDVTFTVKDSIGRFVTSSLFVETRQDSVSNDYPAVYTIEDHDIEIEGKTYYSLHDTYMTIGDPTGYKFAIAVFRSWDHWTRIAKSVRLVDMVKTWNLELEAKITSESVDVMKDIASKGGAKSTGATKWLAERGWVPKATKSSKKAPKKDTEKELRDDAKRIGLKVVK